MHFNRLDLNLLVTLNVLLEEKNITRASEQLHLSQSATSGALGRLREFFGDDLLVQVGRKMVLTPQAESLVKPVHDVLLQLQTIVDAKPNFDPATSERRFKVMMSDYVSTVVVAKAIRALPTIAPGISIEMPPQHDNPSDELERGDLDFLIMPERYLSEYHPCETLFEDGFTCLIWNGNTVVKDQVSLEQYLSLGHVIVRFGDQRMPAFDEWFMERYGFARRVEVIAMSLTQIPQFIVGTNRIATVHQRLADIYTKYLPVKTMPLPVAQMPKLIEKIQWHKTRHRDPGNIWLREFLLQFARTVQSE